MARTSKWTRQHDNILIELMNRGYTAIQCSMKMGVSPSLITQKRKLLGLVSKAKAVWTETEINYLHDIAGEFPKLQLAQNYNNWAVTNGYEPRTYAAIISKAGKLGISLDIANSSLFLDKECLVNLFGTTPEGIEALAQQEKAYLKPVYRADGELEYIERKWLRKTLISHLHIVKRFQKTMDIVYLWDILFN